jgi:hypothetical protein
MTTINFTIFCPLKCLNANVFWPPWKTGDIKYTPFKG